MQINGPQILLVACRDAHGFYRFPVEVDSPFPGIPIVMVEGYSEAMQVEQAVRQIFGDAVGTRKILLRIKFEDCLQISNREPQTLFLAELTTSQDLETVAQWPTLPEILRQMPKDKNRVPYMKVMQVLAGDLEQGVSALELDDKLKEEIKRRLTAPPQN